MVVLSINHLMSEDASCKLVCISTIISYTKVETINGQGKIYKKVQLLYNLKTKKPQQNLHDVSFLIIHHCFAKNCLLKYAQNKIILMDNTVKDKIVLPYILTYFFQTTGSDRFVILLKI